MRLAVPHFNRLIGKSSCDTFPSGNVCSCPFETRKHFNNGSYKKNQKIELHDAYQDGMHTPMRNIIWIHVCFVPLVHSVRRKIITCNHPIYHITLDWTQKLQITQQIVVEKHTTNHLINYMNSWKETIKSRSSKLLTSSFIPKATQCLPLCVLILFSTKKKKERSNNDPSR